MTPTSARLAAATISIAALALDACGGDSAAPSAGSTTSATTTATCSAAQKACGGACASTDDPATGCAAAACTPCALDHASAVCLASGACGVGACASGWGDCDGAPEDGCEADLTTSATNCGACGNACAKGEVCAQSRCVDPEAQKTADWLATQKGGFCQAAFNQLMNLCGDVEFCFDAAIVRPYPDGIALDVGFDWDGLDTNGNVVDVGGDCDQKRVSFRIIATSDGPTLAATGPGAVALSTTIAPGRHLASYRVSTTAAALFLDGVRVATSAGTVTTPELWHECGPGFVLGQRISYWWEDTKPDPQYLRFAPFFVHLRDEVKDASTWSFDDATKAGPRTVVLFDETGASGSSWKASVGPFTGVGKNGSTWVADTRADCFDKK